ncbi:unnamed protein product [Medioppia subpectinata]|uniref:Nuclear pore complex protein Nup153 n=1 Tax=Medioppia subpectinata TaxID=1979941 RepID=A0A7R9KTT0_9ACAR|nr:unnamed protein product [Medioppia subpectinata]CAG2108528.1 unnamed protein product [Medioppia subpectinata]
MNRSVKDLDISGSQSAIKMKSDVERSLRGLNFGRLYLKNNEYENALKSVNAYLNVKPNSSDGHKLMAQIYEAMGDDERAVINYRKALDFKKGTNENYLSYNQMTANNVMSSSMMSDSNSITPTNWSPSVKSTPERNKYSESGSDANDHSCGICSNQTILDKMSAQQESLIATNKVLLDILRQNTSNIKDIQNQLTGINDSINTLTDSQTSLKETIYEYMTQEEEEDEQQDFDDYISENEAILTPNTSQLSQWQSPPIQLNPKLDQTKPLSELFKPAANSWQCDVCYVNNNGSVDICAACETPKPGSAPKQTSSEQKSNLFSAENLNAISFNPSSTSSTTSFKFGAFDANSALNSTTIFSNTGFKFGNTSSPQPLPALSLSNSDFSFQPNKPLEEKSASNIFANNAVDNPKPFSFGLSPKFSFDLNNVSKPEAPKIDAQSNVVNETEEPENTSFNESVEPSNADSIYFQPVIPLPPKVEVKTGEEEETVLHVSRARLFRFCDNEWKERGVGDLKILESQDSKRIRFLMRRDTILKVCLNQYITKELKLDLKDDKKSMTWSGIDYSDETPTPQLFLLRVKNAENAELFLNAFRSAQSRLEVSDKSAIDSSPVGHKSQLNGDLSEKERQLVLSPSKFESKPQSDEEIEILWVKSPQSEEILNKVKELKLPLNFYDYETMDACKGCRGCHDEDYSFQSDSKPTITDHSTDENSTSESLFASAISQANVSQTDWLSNSSPKSWITKTPAPLFSEHKNTGDDDGMTPVFEIAQSRLEVSDKSAIDSSPVGHKSQLNGDLSEKERQSVLSPSKFESKPQSDEEIEILWVKSPQSEEILNKVKELKLPLNFYDYETMDACKGCRGCHDEDYSFQSDSKPTITDNSTDENSTSESLFASAISQANVSQTDWLSNSSPKSWITKTPAPLFSEHNNTGDDDDSVAANPDIYFKPIIPLPELIEVQTGEEDEEPIYCQRAKLYRFDPNLKEWKERGIGDFKILKHKSKIRYRMILRREQILKIACNHYITPEITLNPMNTSETSVCWNAVDFTDGSPVSEQFALKLKNKDLLKDFVKLFEECKSSLESSEVYNSDNEEKSGGDEDTDAEEDQQN